MCSLSEPFGIAPHGNRGLGVSGIIGIAIGSCILLVCVLLIVGHLRTHHQPRAAQTLNPFSGDIYQILPSADEADRTYATSTNPMHASSTDDTPPTYESLPNLPGQPPADRNANLI
jgi:hypothetical protein